MRNFIDLVDSLVKIPMGHYKEKSLEDLLEYLPASQSTFGSHKSFHLFSDDQYLLSIYRMSGAEVGTKDTTVNRIVSALLMQIRVY
jgi:hypothetical protein